MNPPVPRPGRGSSGCRRGHCTTGAAKRTRRRGSRGAFASLEADLGPSAATPGACHWLGHRPNRIRTRRARLRSGGAVQPHFARPSASSRPPPTAGWEVAERRTAGRVASARRVGVAHARCSGRVTGHVDLSWTPRQRRTHRRRPPPRVRGRRPRGRAFDGGRRA